MSKAKLKKASIKKNPQVQQPTQPEQNLPDFTGKHIHIMIPCYSGMLFEVVMNSIIQLINVAPAIKLTLSLDTIGNESLITRGRNNLMARALHNFPNATHFLFIDSDIRFTPADVISLLSDDKDVVGGMYPKKGLPIDYNFNRKVNDQNQYYGDIDQAKLLFEVEVAATGFLMFKREVYERLIEAYPETKYIDDINLGKQYEPYMYAIFDTTIDEKGRYLSEDWTFCRRWTGLNDDNKVWIDPKVLLGHCGTYLFAPQSQEELLAAVARKGIVLTPNTPESVITDPSIIEDFIPDPTPVEKQEAFKQALEEVSKDE